MDAISGELCKHILAVGILYAKTHRRVFLKAHPHTCVDGFISATPTRTAKRLLSVCRAAALPGRREYNPHTPQKRRTRDTKVAY